MGSLDQAIRAFRASFEDTGRKLLASMPDPENRRLELRYDQDWGFRVFAVPTEPDPDREWEAEFLPTSLALDVLRAIVDPS